MNTSVTTLFALLLLAIVLSAFFSAAEIGLMTINRYRVRSRADTGHLGARLVLRLLERPDRLLGVILVGNNTVNVGASFIASLLTLELYGEQALAFAAGLLTFILLVFSEVAPKTLAAINPERIAYPSAYILWPMLQLLYPVVWLTATLGNLWLRLWGVSVKKTRPESITAEEFRALVREADVLIPESHQDMMLAVLDLERITVDDVMVPRNRIQGIDLDAEWDDVVTQISNSQYTRLPVYHGSLDQVAGIVHVRRVLNLLREGRLQRDALIETVIEPYFIPAGTSLTTQLLNFKQARRRIGLVVDEYGDIQGLVTLDEILEEIVGEFTRSTVTVADEVQPQEDGSYLINGTIALRELNRRIDGELPTDGPKTLSGLITEHLEALPEPGTSLQLHGFLLEILRTRGTTVQAVRMRRPPAETPAAVTEPPEA